MGRQQERMDTAAAKEGLPAQEEKGEGPNEKKRKIAGILFTGETGQYAPVADDILRLKKAAEYLVSLLRARGEGLE